MRTDSTVLRYAVIPSALGLMLSVTGCDFVSGAKGLVSGANLKPTVRYKAGSADSAAETAAPTETAAADTSAGGTGSLKGKVVFDGSFTPLPPIYSKGGDVKDAAVCAAEDAPNQTILVKDGGLANTFVYLRKAPKVASPVPTDELIFDQKHCVFKPHAMTMRMGQTIKVLNSDGVAHNTHTIGKKTTDFNKIVPPNDTSGATLIYKQAEQDPISVVCDIHPWMKAFHFPTDHPFVAVSGEDGSFEIKDLPAGKHEFKVWHEAGGLLEKALVVTIKPGDNDLTIKVKPAQLGK